MFFPSITFLIKIFLKLLFPNVCYMHTPNSTSSSSSANTSPSDSAALNRLLKETPISASLIGQLLLDGTPLDSSSSSSTATTLPQSASLRGRILDSSLRIFRAQSPRPALDFFQYQTACVVKFVASLPSAVTDDTLDFYILEYLYSMQDSATLSTSAGGSRTSAIKVCEGL